MHLEYNHDIKYVYAWLSHKDVEDGKEVEIDNYAENLGYKSCIFLSGEGNINKVLEQLIENNI